MFEPFLMKSLCYLEFSIHYFKPTNQFLASLYRTWHISQHASATDQDSVMYLTSSNLPLHFREDYACVDGCCTSCMHMSTIFVKSIVYNEYIATVRWLISNETSFEKKTFNSFSKFLPLLVKNVCYLDTSNFNPQTIF